ncbi:Nuclear control of ATPase protein 2 [Coemansia helicoidea]|uniref:Nuclear control of ATPase protein 2 n=1 Tax=Coemansia helicoidea TaxID=1286919 RepID=A0ACC1L8H9_9FUNG|nr:Nuclear control of ATPase protein 2 [Coemansia helicoidea]
MSFVDNHYARVFRLLALGVQQRQQPAAAAVSNDPQAGAVERRLRERAFALSTQLPVEPPAGDKAVALSGSQAPTAVLQPALPGVAAACPPLAGAVADLQLVSAALASEVGAAELSEVGPAAEVVLANAVAVIHAQAIRQLLEAVLPLSADIDYWHAQDSSALRLAVYFAQTLPQRLYLWTVRVVGTVYRQSAAAASSQRSAPGGLGGQFRRLVSKRSLFPMARQLAPGAGGGLATARLLRVPDGLDMLGLVRHEVRFKKHRLVAMQQQLARAIGMLSQAALERGAGSDQQSTAAQRLLQQAAEVVQCLVGAGAMPPEPGCNVQASDIAALAGRAMLTAEQVRRIPALVGLQVQEHGRPSLATRCWMPAVALVVGARTMSSYVVGHQDSLRAWAADALYTARNYVAQYILAPLRSGYETVRYGRHTYSVMSEESLASDLQSLESMTVGFAARYGDADAAAVSQRVQHGDLSDVMRTYAREMQQPIRSALFGDLVEAMLIQVQKVKVDVGQTMAALDKLLKANELNFLLLSTVPATLTIFAAAKWLASRLSWWVSGSSRDMVSSIQAVVRDIDRLLNANAGAAGGGQLSAVAQGRLVCLTHYLRHHAARLRNPASADTLRTAAGWAHIPPRTRTLFLQDICDLENVELDIPQKLRVVDRMFRTFRFL